MVLWLSANDDDIIRVDEFLHLYHLRLSTHLGIGSSSLGMRNLGWSLILSLLSVSGRRAFSLFLVMVGRSLQMKIWMMLLS